MEGIFIPNPVNASQGDNLNEAVKEEEESKLVTTVEEIASAMLRLALEFGEKGFLQREFILYLRRLMREITGEEQPEMPIGATAMPLSAQPEMENVCPHPEHHLTPEFPASPAAGGMSVYDRPRQTQSLRAPRVRRNIFSPVPEVSNESSAGDYRRQMQSGGPSRMQSPTRLGAIKRVPATASKMERQISIPSTPMNTTFSLPQGSTTGRKYTYADLSSPSQGSGYSDSGEWVGKPGAVIPCRITPLNPPMNDSYYCEHLRPSPKQNLFGQVGVDVSPMNDSYYCQPLPQTPMTRRSTTGKKSSVRRPRQSSISRGSGSSSLRR